MINIYTIIYNYINTITTSYRTIELFNNEDLELLHFSILKVINKFYNAKLKILLGMDLNFHGLFIIVKYGKTKYERLIVISEKFIYKLTSLNIASFQWALAIDSIQSIKIVKGTPNSLKLQVKSSINKKIVGERKFPINSKDEYEFNFKYATDMNNFIFQIKKHSFNNTKTLLKVTY
jgi:hypothetical protein